MPNRSSKRKKADHDFNVVASRVVQQATGEAQEPEAEPELLEPREDGKNPAAVSLGRLGGKKGGPARAAKLTAAQRSEIARRAAQARWRKPRPS